MRFTLSQEQAAIRSMARDVLADKSTFASVRRAAEDGRRDDELWAQVGELGWPGIAISREAGGVGLGVVELCVLAEEAGAACAAMPFLGSALAAMVIERSGTREQQDRWLESLINGRAVGALGMLGDDTPIPDAGAADVVVMVDPVNGRALLYVRSEVDVVTTIDPTLSYGRVAAGVVGESMPGSAAEPLDAAAVVVSAHLLGVARGALDMSVRYVSERHQFGVPVGSFQAVSHRLAQMYFDTEAARSLSYFAAWALDSDDPEAAAASARAKAWAAETSRGTAGSAIHAHGGIGFTWEADVHWLYKRAAMFGPYLGGASFHRRRLINLIAPNAIVRSA